MQNMSLKDTHTQQVLHGISMDLTSGAKDIMPYGEAQQLSFFRESDEPTMEHPFMAELREKDLSDMTPLEALNYLYVLQEKLKNEE